MTASALGAFLFISTSFSMDQVLSTLVVVISIVLLGISVVSYKKTGLSRMLLMSGAFGFFALKILFEHFGVWILNWTAQTEEVASLGMDLVILLLFFLALMVRR